MDDGRLPDEMTLETLARKLDELSTKLDLAPFATKDDLDRFATKDDLDRFATKDDLDRFATKDDLARFATRTEDRFSELIAHSKMVAEDLKDTVKRAAEGYGATLDRIERDLGELTQKVEIGFADRDKILSDHEQRITTLEGANPRPAGRG